MPIWITIVEWLARGILALLSGLSIWSIAIILDRRAFFRLISSDQFLKDVSKERESCPETQRKALFTKKLVHTKLNMEKRLSILGTLGSTAPFIGLLGTVLGIIVAFGELSLGSGDSKTIMFALAEALVLTAVGLFVAIPAVIAFNIFKKKIHIFMEETLAEARVLFNELEDL